MTRTNGEGSGNTFHQSLISVIIISMINRPPPSVALIGEREKRKTKKGRRDVSSLPEGKGGWGRGGTSRVNSGIALFAIMFDWCSTAPLPRRAGRYLSDL